jgi:2-iminoacetate synthase ThiH
MFNDVLGQTLTHVRHIQAENALDRNELCELLQKAGNGQRLEPEELISVLSSSYEPKLRRVILDFSARLERPHDTEVLLLPPLYFSSICENSCLYCDFSADGQRLPLDLFERELNALLEEGYRSIELVSSQDTELYVHRSPFSFEDQMFFCEGAREYFHIAACRLRENGGGMLTCNIPPLDLESLTKLKAAGLDCFLLWQECFDPTQYTRLHRNNGPKSNQAFRLNAFERALAAGIEHLAGAFLKGLYDWRKEEFVLYMFDKHLKTTYGRGFSIIGTPRLKGNFIESDLVSRYRVSDEDYELNIALDRILFDGILWLQTREHFSMNRALLQRYGGGTILTISCSTAPGGYSQPSTGRAQFPVYNRKVSDSIRLLEEDGLTVRFDWNSQTLSDFQRS